MIRPPTKPCLTFVLACVAMANASASCQARAADKDATLPITVINYSALPVHAAVIALDEDEICAKLGLPTGVPLRVGTGDKESSIPWPAARRTAAPSSGSPNADGTMRRAAVQNRPQNYKIVALSG